MMMQYGTKYMTKASGLLWGIKGGSFIGQYAMSHPVYHIDQIQTHPDVSSNVWDQ